MCFPYPKQNFNPICRTLCKKKSSRLFSVKTGKLASFLDTSCCSHLTFMDCGEWIDFLHFVVTKTQVSSRYGIVHRGNHGFAEFIMK